MFLLSAAEVQQGDEAGNKEHAEEDGGDEEVLHETCLGRSLASFFDTS